MSPDPSLPWAIPLEAVNLIANAEGCKLRSYLCPAGVWTIGWGHTAGVKEGQTITQAQADRMMCEEVAERTEQVRGLLKRPATGGQLGALVSLQYNIGQGALAGSTLLRLHNAGDTAGAAAQFKRWNRAGGRVLNGLVKRRAAEAALYLKDA
jgi:lysozyme